MKEKVVVRPAAMAGGTSVAPVGLLGASLVLKPRSDDRGYFLSGLRPSKAEAYALAIW
jgi:hypothetical protein